MIDEAEYNDLQEILKLQYLSYQSEAALFGSKDIPPLKQTLNEVIDEFNNGIILKMVIDNEIIGSVRAKEQNGTVYIANLWYIPIIGARDMVQNFLQRLKVIFQRSDMSFLQAREVRIIFDYIKKWDIQYLIAKRLMMNCNLCIWKNANSSLLVRL